MKNDSDSASGNSQAKALGEILDDIVVATKQLFSLEKKILSTEEDK